MLMRDVLSVAEALSSGLSVLLLPAGAGAVGLAPCVLRCGQ